MVTEKKAHYDYFTKANRFLRKKFPGLFISREEKMKQMFILKECI